MKNTFNTKNANYFRVPHFRELREVTTAMRNIGTQSWYFLGDKLPFNGQFRQNTFGTRENSYLYLYEDKFLLNH